MLHELVLKNRSYRRFDSTSKVPMDTLEELVDLARLCPSGRNLQPLKFMPVNMQSECELVFPCLAWAGYLKDWDGPDIGERPAAYIIIMGDTRIGSLFDTDLGICAQTILLGAVEKGLGGCMIGSIKKDELKSVFSLPDELKILLVLALGKPVEKVVIEPVRNDDIRYWRDQDHIHHVPKRSMEDVLIRPGLL